MFNDVTIIRILFVRRIIHNKSDTLLTWLCMV